MPWTPSVPLMSKLHYCMRVDVIGGGEGGSKNNVHWTLSVAMVEFRVSPYTFRHFQRVQTHILLRSTFEVCKSSPNAGGGNYEYLAVVSDSLTRTNLAWKVGVEQSL